LKFKFICTVNRKHAIPIEKNKDFRRSPHPALLLKKISVPGTEEKAGKKYKKTNRF
jgi:hypothetical protein